MSSVLKTIVTMNISGSTHDWRSSGSLTACFLVLRCYCEDDEINVFHDFLTTSSTTTDGLGTGKQRSTTRFILALETRQPSYSGYDPFYMLFVQKLDMETKHCCR